MLVKVYRISDYDDVIAPATMTFQDAIEFYEDTVGYTAEDPNEYDEFGELPESFVAQYRVQLDCESEDVLPLAEYIEWAAARGDRLPILLSSNY